MKLILLLLALIPTLAAAQEGVRVIDAWTPPSIAQPNSVGFMTLTASSDDALTAVQSDCCAVVEMHSMTMKGDVMRMRRVKEIALPGRTEVTLESGGYHLMLIGLKKPLNEGEAVPVTLNFKHAEPLNIVLEVKKRNASTHEHMGHH